MTTVLYIETPCELAVLVWQSAGVGGCVGKMEDLLGIKYCRAP